MKRISAVAAMVATLALVGCAEESAPNDSARTGTVSGSNFAEVSVKLSDGRTVQCVRDVIGAGNGISCDWSNAK